MLSKHNKIFLASIALLSALLALRIFLRPLGQDEGVFLTIGQGIARGLLPYRDFFDHKPPGIHLLIAGLYHLLGNKVLGYKIFLLITQLVSAGLVWRITADLCLLSCLAPLETRDKLQQKTATLGPRVKPEDDEKKSPNSWKLEASSYLWAPLFFLSLTIIFEGERFLAEPFIALFLLLAVYCYLQSNRLTRKPPINNLQETRYSSASSHSSLNQRAHPSESKTGPLRDKQTTSIKMQNANVTMKQWNSGTIVCMFLSGLFLGLALLFKQTAVLSIAAFYLFLLIKREWRSVFYITIGATLPIGIALAYLFLNNLLPEAYRQIVLYNLAHYPREPLARILLQLLPYFLYTLPIWALYIVRVNRELRFSIPRHTPPKNRYSGFVILNSSLLFLLALLPLPAYFIRHYPHYWLQSVPFVAVLASLGLYTLRCELRDKGTRASACGDKSWYTRQGAQTFSPLVYLAKWGACWIALISIILSYQFVRFNYPKLQDERRIASYLRGKNKCIYAENQFTASYFLADKRPLNKYLYLTEITESSENSAKITLEQLRVSGCLFLWPADLNYAYAKDIQSYITSNYRPVYWTRSLDAVVYSKAISY